jgi:hypothetical protein
MLALDRPLGVVADLALFGDHTDTKRVFYITTRPQLAKTSSGAEISFVKFRRTDPVAGGAAFLSFTTELAASEQQLHIARQHLVSQGISEPELVQPPWVKGKAFLAAALKEGDGFVEHLLGEVTPDLAGSNRATFSAMLKEDGARLVESLLHLDGANPLGVRYELEYEGLRPALGVKLKADYSRVYKEMSVGFEFGVAYEGIGARAGVETATKKLVESGAIQVEVFRFTDDADLKGRVDQAIRWFQNRILEDFFKSSLQPPAHENLLSKAIEAAKSLGAASLQDAMANQQLAGQLAQSLGLSNDALGALAAKGTGAGAAGGADSTFALKLQLTFRDIHQEELKTVTLDWSEARAERRTAAPQGLLSSFGSPPNIIEAEDSGKFWERLEVNVRPLGDFAALGVERLVVQIAYPHETVAREQKAFTFEPEKTDPKLFSVWTDGQGPSYRTRTEVHFRDDGPWAGEPVFTGAWHTSQSLELAVHPLSDVPRIEVELAAGSLKFDEVSQVQLDLRLNGSPLAARKLTEEHPSTLFRYRPKPVAEMPLTLEVRPTWFLAAGGNAQGEWLPVEGTAVLVGGPWRGERAVRVFPLLPEDFIEAVVTLTMTENNRTQSVDVRFEAGERRTKTVKFPTLSDEPPSLHVDVVVIRGDGSTFIGSPYETTAPIILVRDREGEQRQLSVKLLSGPSLFDHGLIAVQVQLLDQSGGELDTILFTESQRKPGVLLVPLGEDGSKTVRYRVVRYASNGAASTGPVLETADSELLIPAVAPTT